MNWLYELFGEWRLVYYTKVQKKFFSSFSNKEWYENGIAVIEKHSISGRLRAYIEMRDGSVKSISLKYLVEQAKSEGVSV